jgi:hypothetical protein
MGNRLYGREFNHATQYPLLTTRGAYYGLKLCRYTLFTLEMQINFLYLGLSSMLCLVATALIYTASILILPYIYNIIDLFTMFIW